MSCFVWQCGSERDLFSMQTIYKEMPLHQSPVGPTINVGLQNTKCNRSWFYQPLADNHWIQCNMINIPPGPDFCFLHGFTQILVLICLSWITAPKIIKKYSGYLGEFLTLAKKWRVSCSVVPHSLWHRILQTRILAWDAIPFSRRSSQPRDWTWVSCIAGRFFTIWATREA